MTYSLFQTSDPYEPLAARLRPGTINAFLGQDHILGPDKPLTQAIENATPHSMIFWGPPGTGKTTLARIIAASCDAHFEALSAVLSGVKDIREAIIRAQQVREKEGRNTILFVDEVHRFNKSQQDAFLPHIEDGTVIFIGATTENPSFELNNALLSRARVYVLKSLDDRALLNILDHALSDEEHGLGKLRLVLSEEQKSLLVGAADGDARRLLNLLEIASDLAEEDKETKGDAEEIVISDEQLALILQGNTRRFDKGGDSFYEQISALHKAVRGSSPDAALYWLCRMLDGGCDPLYIARRMVRMASEDIGNADPRALTLTLNAWDTQERLGSPEGELALAHVVVYLACAPKSNAVYSAFKAAMRMVKESPSEEVPMHLRNAPTRLMKDMDYGSEYRYAHDEPGAYAPGENYFPEALARAQFYHPTDRGLEGRIQEKLNHFRQLDATAASKRYAVSPATKGENN